MPNAHAHGCMLEADGRRPEWPIEPPVYA